MRKTGSNWLKFIFLVYLAILLRITVFRTGFSMSHLMQNGTVNLTLFQDYIPLIRQGRWFRFVYLFVGNIVWFVPLGCALTASGNLKRLRTAALCGLGLSLAIETMQYLFGTGVSELDDLVLNTLGTWIGAAGGRLYRNHPGRSR
ncbi:VanZ family protein [uncultured Clostridium sp.]|uniref:VanZ family protein n=1 Tax=uncultured Clostridium sp. TaxID=59620 RepID=UPI0025E1EE8B|nr:VanZ family protein [uncultured Clostridium sp.]